MGRDDDSDSPHVQAQLPTATGFLLNDYLVEKHVQLDVRLMASAAQYANPDRETSAKILGQPHRVNPPLVFPGPRDTPAPSPG